MTGSLYSVFNYLFAIVFMFAGAIKILGLIPAFESVKVVGVFVNWSRGQRDSLEVSPTLWYVIGALEWAAVAGLLLGAAGWTTFAAAAGAGLVLLLFGATGYRVRARDWSLMGAPTDIFLLLLVSWFTYGAAAGAL